MLVPLLLGCTPDPDPSEGIVTASGAASEHVPSVLLVTIDGPGGTAFVEYGLDDAFDQRTPDFVRPTPSVRDATDAVIPVLGLKASHAYRWRAVVVDADGERHVSEPATFDVPSPPAGLRPIEVSIAEDEAELRYFLAAVIEPGVDSWAAILDRDGDWVWWASTDGTVIVTAETGLDGRSVGWSQYDFAKFDDVGKFVRLSLDGTTRTETRLRMGHHDIVQHDDGTLAFLGISFADVVVGGDSYRMASDTISVGPEGMTDADTPELRFDMFEDFPLDPVVTCQHVASKEDKLGERNVSEWTHANSFMYVDEDDAWYVNDKFTDWLIKIDRGTGDVVWTMNGRGGDFTRPDGEPIWTDVRNTSLWSHGHMSDIWSGGGMMFDNGDHHVPNVSRAVEFAWDEEAMTAEIVWEYRHPEGLATAALGDVRRMPGDDVLITWSGLGEVDEVTRDGRVVWKGRTEGTQMIGRLVPIHDLYGTAP
jgi:hypothetical protein